MSRSPGQTLMVCGAFVGTAPRASYSTSNASGGASLRFSRSSKRQRSESSWHQPAPAPGQVVQQLAVLQLLADLRPREAIQDCGQLPEVPEEQEANLLVHAQAGYVSPQKSI